MDLSVVVPCYNEAPAPARQRRRAAARCWRRRVASTRSSSWTIAARTKPGALLHDICAETPHCRYIFHERNRGRGGAFKTGFAASSGRVTGFPRHRPGSWRALHPGALVNLIEHHNVDVVTGYRHYIAAPDAGAPPRGAVVGSTA